MFFRPIRVVPQHHLKLLSCVISQSSCRKKEIVQCLQLGFRVSSEGLRFRVRVYGLGLRFRVEILGLGVKVSGF